MEKSIDIRKFIYLYYGIEVNNISHHDVSKLIPGIKRVSFEYIKKNEELIYYGKVIYLFDSYGEVLPYLCPDEFYNIDYDDYIDTPVNNDKDIDLTKEELQNQVVDMNKGELLELLHKYKKIYSFYRIIKKELDIRYAKTKKEYNRKIKHPKY